jgi:hypothetical protein
MNVCFFVLCTFPHHYTFFDKILHHDGESSWVVLDTSKLAWVSVKPIYFPTISSLRKTLGLRQQWEHDNWDRGSSVIIARIWEKTQPIF